MGTVTMTAMMPYHPATGLSAFLRCVGGLLTVKVEDVGVLIDIDAEILEGLDPGAESQIRRG